MATIIDNAEMGRAPFLGNGTALILRKSSLSCIIESDFSSTGCHCFKNKVVVKTEVEKNGSPDVDKAKQGEKTLGNNSNRISR
jgi:hypothetical protein